MNQLKQAMKQMELFNNNDSPFLRRWHLYKDDQFVWTAIPLDDYLRLIGRDPKDRKNVPYDEYEAFKRKHNLREVQP